MEEILITGASGFLGRRAAAALAGRYRVLTPSHRELDVTDEEALRRYLELHRPDLVLHCAAISDTGRCRREPEAGREVNTEGCVRLVRAAREAGSRCVLCSSDQVYSGSSSLWPHREDELLSPDSPYGRGKLEAEQRCLALDPDCVFLRLSWMYDREALDPGEHGDFLRTLLARMQARQPLSFPIYDRRGITDVREVVRSLDRAFLLPGGVYNFGSVSEQSTFALMQRVFDRLGLDPEQITADAVSFSDRPRNLCMDPWKAEHRGVFFPSSEESLARNIFPFFHK